MGSGEIVLKKLGYPKCLIIAMKCPSLAFLAAAPKGIIPPVTDTMRSSFFTIDTASGVVRFNSAARSFGMVVVSAAISRNAANAGASFFTAAASRLAPTWRWCWLNSKNTRGAQRPISVLNCKRR